MLSELATVDEIKEYSKQWMSDVKSDDCSLEFDVNYFEKTSSFSDYMCIVLPIGTIKHFNISLDGNNTYLADAGTITKDEHNNKYKFIINRKTLIDVLVSVNYHEADVEDAILLSIYKFNKCRIINNA